MYDELNKRRETRRPLLVTGFRLSEEVIQRKMVSLISKTSKMR
jgi:hypothetical protein